MGPQKEDKGKRTSITYDSLFPCLTKLEKEGDAGERVGERNKSYELIVDFFFRIPKLKASKSCWFSEKCREQ